MSHSTLKIFFYALGNIVPRMISLILVSMLSFGLSKAEMGIYDLLLNAISLVMPILTLQLGEACYRWIYGQSDYNVYDILKTALIFLFCFDLGLWILFESMIFFLNLTFESSFLAVLFSSAIFTLFQSIARALNHTKVYAFSGILNSVAIISFILFYFYGGAKNMDSILKAYIFSNLISLVYIVFHLDLNKIFKNGLYKSLIIIELLKYSMPLIPAAISWWIVYFANRYIILYSLGIEANGIYGVAARIPSLLLLFNHIFSMGFQDNVFAKISKSSQTNNYSSLFKLFFTFQMTVTMLLIAFIKPITHYLFASSYFESYKITVLLLTGTLLTNCATFLGTFYLADKQTTNLLKTIFIGAFINIIFTCLTINTLGLYAAAMGTTFSFGMICYLRYLYIMKKMIFDLNHKYILKLSIIFIFILGSIYISNIFLEISIVLFSLSLFYFYNQLIINKIYAKFRESFS